jgi:G3E family GTPase
LAEELHSGIRQQTELADVVIINKSDLVEPATLDAIANQVRVLNPRATLFITQRGVMDYDQLLSRTGEISSPVLPHRCPPVHDHFHTLTVLCDTPLVRERFETLMRTLPETVWRAKGFVRFDDSDEQWMFQSVLGDFAIEWIDLLPEPPEHVVFIGKSFDRRALRRAVLSCSASSVHGRTE